MHLAKQQRDQEKPLSNKQAAGSSAIVAQLQLEDQEEKKQKRIVQSVNAHSA